MLHEAILTSLGEVMRLELPLATDSFGSSIKATSATMTASQRGREIFAQPLQATTQDGALTLVYVVFVCHFYPPVFTRCCRPVGCHGLL